MKAVKSVELDNERIQIFDLKIERVVNVVENQGNIDLYYVEDTDLNNTTRVSVSVAKYGEDLADIPVVNSAVFSVPVNGRVYHFFVYMDSY